MGNLKILKLNKAQLDDYLETLKKELDINYMDLGEYYFHKDKIDENYDTKTQVAKIRNRAIEFKLKKNQKVIHNFIFYFNIIRSK